MFGFKIYFFNRRRLQRLKFFTAIADIAKKIFYADSGNNF
jgi:hypothetical protein